MNLTETRDVLKQDGKRFLTDFLPMVTNKGKTKNQWVCPYCHSGDKKSKTPAFTSYENTNSFHCFSCGTSGDIYDLYAHVNNLDIKRDFKQVLEGVWDTFNIDYPKLEDTHETKVAPMQLVPTPTVQNQPQVDPQEEQFKQNLMQWDMATAVQHPNRYAYLMGRGISEEVQARFNVGLIEQWATIDTRLDADRYQLPIEPYKISPRCIIPTSANSYLARDIRPNSMLTESQQKYSKIKMGRTHTMNLESITPNGNPVLVCEGEITAMSAITLGFEAIALGTTSRVKTFFEDEYYNAIGKDTNKEARPVMILCFDNDQAGMDATSKAMKICQATNIPVVTLPTSFYDQGCNDLNDMLIHNRDGLKQKLEKVFTKASKFNYKSIGKLTEKAEKPKEVPCFVEKRYNQIKGKFRYIIHEGRLAKYIMENETFKFDKQNLEGSTLRYLYDTEEGVYRLVSDEDMRVLIKKYIDDFDDTLAKKKCIEEVLYQINHTEKNFLKRTVHMNDDENTICMGNGVLDLENLTLTEHTPNALMTIKVDADFTPENTSTPTWDRYLNEFTCGRKDIQKTLMEFMGACVSNVYGYKFKKCLMMYGEKDTAKSTIRDFVNKVLGEENTSSATLAGINERFGTSTIFNKRLVGSVDMSSEDIEEIGIFKSITGGDTVKIEFKNKTPFEATYKGMVWFCTNQLPDIPAKHQDEFYDRLIMIPCEHVVKNKDKTLPEKLYAERSAFITKCIIALREAVQRGYEFTIPQASAEANKEYQTMNNPVAQFFNECVVERKDGEIHDNCTTKKLFDVFKAYCQTYGFFIKNVNQFRKLVAKFYETKDINTLIKRTAENTYYTFTLNARAKRDFAMVYGYDSATN